MPVFRQDEIPVAQHDELIQALAAELLSEPDTHVSEPEVEQLLERPNIYEEEVPQTGALHVVVVWDQLSATPRLSRGSIILAAYRQVDPDKSQRIRFPVGLTFDEAISSGYLPFKIVLEARHGDPLDMNAVESAMIKAGGRRTESGTIELRFPYLGLAEQALQQLQKTFGDGTFAVIEQAGFASASWS
jgi:hypothetical protein